MAQKFPKKSATDCWAKRILKLFAVSFTKFHWRTSIFSHFLNHTISCNNDMGDKFVNRWLVWRWVKSTLIFFFVFFFFAYGICTISKTIRIICCINYARLDCTVRDRGVFAAVLFASRRWNQARSSGKLFFSLAREKSIWTSFYGFHVHFIQRSGNLCEHLKHQKCSLGVALCVLFSLSFSLFGKKKFLLLWSEFPPSVYAAHALE